MTFSSKDLKIFDDPIAVLRRNPSMYAGEKPRGPRFSARLLHDLIFLDALPARVERVTTWWLVAAKRDWLRSPEGVLSKEPFHVIVSFPAAGHAAFRAEILLTAFADAVVTCDADGLDWIVGDEKKSPLPGRWLSEIANVEQGRIIA